MLKHWTTREILQGVLKGSLGLLDTTSDHAYTDQGPLGEEVTHDFSDPEMLQQVIEPKQTLRSSARCLGYKI